MGRRISAAMTLMAVVAALFALVLATVPAAAHHKDEHSGGGNNGAAESQADKGNGKGGSAKDNDGDADSDSNTAYTEDNDTNDGGTPNNQADEGDNAHPSGKDRSVENGGSGNQGNSESDPDDDGRGPDRSNGGPDKPNGSGGVDKADQDGNNGCGNDDDFEDDNEGWCGRKPKPTKPEVKPAGPCDADATMPGTQPCKDDDVKPCDKDATMPGTQPCKDDDPDTGVSPTTPCVEDEEMAAGDEELCNEDDVESGLISRPATPDLQEPRTVEEPEVLGERLVQAEPDEEGAPAERAASVLGQTLPFTGSALLSYGAIAVGLLLAGAGLMSVRSKA